MTWVDERTIDVGRGQKVNALWHCFGVKHEVVDRKTALAMLRASQTALLPINCHRVFEVQPIYGPKLPYGEPLIGHGDIRWGEFQPLAESMGLIPCLNINLQTSASQAVLLARIVHEQTGIDLLKLEVLSEDHSESNDDALLEAAGKLVEDGFRVMPLVSDSVEHARALAEMDVPLLRVMGSPIGSGRGIDHPRRIQEIVALGKPVILDGGIGYIGHALQALRLGCAGLLVNSMLFKGDDPVGTLRHVRSALKQWTPEWEGPILTASEEEGWEQRARANGVAEEYIEWFSRRSRV